MSNLIGHKVEFFSESGNSVTPKGSLKDDSPCTGEVCYHKEGDVTALVYFIDHNGNPRCAPNVPIFTQQEFIDNLYAGLVFAILVPCGHECCVLAPQEDETLFLMGVKPDTISQMKKLNRLTDPNRPRLDTTGGVNPGGVVIGSTSDGPIDCGVHTTGGFKSDIGSPGGLEETEDENETPFLTTTGK